MMDDKDLQLYKKAELEYLDLKTEYYLRKGCGINISLALVKEFEDHYDRNKNKIFSKLLFDSDYDEFKKEVARKKKDYILSFPSVASLHKVSDASSSTVVRLMGTFKLFKYIPNSGWKRVDIYEI